ncbi:MAG: efflux transporter outer membrane subunit, partial [Bacteroidales bacterium]|nr:efflux transporter outer membrane subunit [Bacteroidales bacterium]
MKKIKYISCSALLAISVVSLSSCAVGKTYKSPGTDTTVFRNYETGSDTTSIADMPWDEFFTDSYLKELISEGLRNNFDMQIAMERIRASEANLMKAKAAFFPSVSLVGDVNHNRTSDGVSGKDVLGYSATDYSLGISASWELDVWRKLHSQKKADWTSLQSVYAYRNVVQTSLISNIATSYYSLLALDEQLRITKETVIVLEKNVETMQALKDAGMVTGAAIEQSKALLHNTQVEVPELENQINELENSICLLLGKVPQSIDRSSIVIQQVPEKLEAGIPVHLLGRRPDIRQAEYDFMSAFELTNVARANMYPSISLTSGSIGFVSASISDFFKPEKLAVNLLGGITQPIFSQRKLKTQLEVSKAQQEEARINFEKTVLNATVEVSDILYGFNSSVKKNISRISQIESLHNAVSFTQELLLADEANYTEVLTAEQNLLNAKINQVNDKLEQLQYHVNLYRA